MRVQESTWGANIKFMKGVEDEDSLGVYNEVAWNGADNELHKSMCQNCWRSAYHKIDQRVTKQYIWCHLEIYEVQSTCNNC